MNKAMEFVMDTASGDNDNMSDHHHHHYNHHHQSTKNNDNNDNNNKEYENNKPFMMTMKSMFPACNSPIATASFKRPSSEISKSKSLQQTDHKINDNNNSNNNNMMTKSPSFQKPSKYQQQQQKQQSQPQQQQRNDGEEDYQLQDLNEQPNSTAMMEEAVPTAKISTNNHDHNSQNNHVNNSDMMVNLENADCSQMGSIYDEWSGKIIERFDHLQKIINDNNKVMKKNSNNSIDYCLQQVLASAKNDVDGEIKELFMKLRDLKSNIAAMKGHLEKFYSSLHLITGMISSEENQEQQKH